jgi:predicted enzyme related to lactoylglutathione lyase
MSLRSSPWATGVPCWIDLRTPDLAAAQDVYAQLFGWDYRTGDGFAIAVKDGSAVAALLAADEPRGKWTMYVASDDVNATAQAVEANAGTVVSPPGAVGEFGWACQVSDPGGAVFGVWQHGTSIGAELINEPGAFVWEDLAVARPREVQAFYSGVFDWHFGPMPQAGSEYALIMGGDPFPLGGIGLTEPGQQPGWRIYIGVSDTDETVAAMIAQGGSVVRPTFTTPYGRHAILADPAGAVFSVIETDGAQQPDRSG